MKKIYLLFIALLSINIMVCSQPTSLGNGVYNWGEQTGNSFYTRFKTSLAVDNSGNKWIGYTRYGISKFDGTTWTLYNVANGNLPSDSVTSITTNGSIVYVGTKNGIAKYNNGNWSTINTSNSILISNIINTLFFKNNTLWVGTNNGVSKLNGSTWTSYSTSNSQLCNNNVQAIEQTTNGDVWFGTISGLSRLSGTNWTTFNNTNSSLADSNIISLCSNNNNQLFIGTNSKGAFVFKNNTLQSLLSIYSQLQGYVYDISHTNLLQTKIFDLAKDTSGNIYLSTMTGSTSFELIKFSATDCKIYILGNTIPIFLEIENPDTIWFVNTLNTSISTGSNLYSLALIDGSVGNTHTFLEINNVKAGIMSSGYLYNDPSTFGSTSYFLVPKDSGKSTIFAGSLWLGTKDSNQKLHLAAQRYYEQGIDFQPGPISTDTSIYHLEKDKWNRVWKVSQAEINFHVTHYNNTSYVMPIDIATWPGNGNPAYGQSKYLAPYVDANNNGIYDPQNGDYPIIRGDEALYFIYNDDLLHTETQGLSITAEIHGLAYAFNAPNDTALNNTIFINYRIYNRSQNNYDSLYIGSFTDFDIGYAFDDYVGCDTNLSMFYGYNGKNIDGEGESWAYGAYPPAQGVTLLNNQMSSFDFNNGTGDPQVAIEYYNLMNGINYMFPGNPTDSTESSEVSAHNPPGDRRGLGSTGPYSFHKDSCHCIDLAYTYSRSYTDTMNTASVTKLKQDVQHVRDYYNSNLIHNCYDLFSAVNNFVEAKPEVFVYPNPASTVIKVGSKN